MGSWSSRRWSLGIACLTLLGVACGVTLARARADPGVLIPAEARIAADFAARGIAYPPPAVTLIALKSEGRLELWADTAAGARFVRSYLVRAGSGVLGPKLREGDHQVPEGVYRIESLNPNSSYHLSMRLDYPNADDLARARGDGRSALGGDIMIHGDRVSDGCLPVGNPAIEELFALVSRVGVESVAVIVSPVDLRRVGTDAALARVSRRPAWLGERYVQIAAALRAFPVPGAGSAPADARGDDGKQSVRASQPKCEAYDARDCAARCAKGDLASCGRAGALFADARITSPPRPEAWALLEKACSGGDAFGCAALADLLVADDGARRDVARAAELARRACDGGEGHGCHRLAKLCTDRLVYPVGQGDCSTASVQRLRERAVARLRADCRGWGAYDCRALAEIYATGDRSNALRFASGACKAGDPAGCEQLALLTTGGGDGRLARVGE
jgi:hypothetical protein